MDANVNPRISVVIPCYNRTEPLKRAIVSVLKQTFTDFEIIVVDDASTILPDEVMNSLNDPRIRLIRHEKNQHAAAARNTGGKAAKGEYIALLDSDDEWKPEHLQRRLDTITADKVDGVYGAAVINKSGEIINIKEIGDVNAFPNMLDYLLSGRCRACTPSLFFTKKAFLDTLFDAELQQYQDYDFNIRFHEKHTYAFDTEATVIVHISTPNSISNTLDHPSYLRFIHKHKPKLPVNTFMKLLSVIARKTIGTEGRTFVFFKYLLIILKRRSNTDSLKLVLGIAFPSLFSKLNVKS